MELSTLFKSEVSNFESQASTLNPVDMDIIHDKLLDLWSKVLPMQITGQREEILHLPLNFKK